MPGVKLIDHQSQTDFIEQFYQFLKEQSTYVDGNLPYKYLNILLMNKDNPDFITLLHTRELEALKSGQYSLTYMMLYVLRPDVV